MSFSAPDPLSLAGLTSALPAISQTALPAGVRAGNAKAKEAYAEGLQFEQVLVEQLTQQLAAGSSSGSSGTDSSSGSDSEDSDGGLGSGLLGDSSAASGYASLIPQALTSTIMAGGGLGIAQEIASAIDPSINDAGKAVK